ncbi:hypothetical protein B9H04_02545 [Halorubrum ezzemoulense DSM 17463]|uniref:Uncharacterized protein n=1 Tax=Halorubrum ezzemoulense DSM 17463 TaxID=1121945 RepID=A0A1X4HB31_HALEZ|nr:hypothetical protein [Halorubrum ezzemoulense]OSP10620.1 hypothetical protein B9H04_02545 [Halorubrum ezzemoulense DSM 17463]
MPRVPSDGEDVSSVRVSLARSGGTRRPCVRLPDDDALDGRVASGACDAPGVSQGDLIRVATGRDEYHARVAADSRGRLLRGAFDNRRLARESGEGTNRLVEWRDANGREPGESVVLDVVVSGELYGLRIPGERTVYDADRGPRSSLADIARDVDG